MVQKEMMKTFLARALEAASDRGIILMRRSYALQFEQHGTSLDSFLHVNSFICAVLFAQWGELVAPPWNQVPGTKLL